MKKPFHLGFVVSLAAMTLGLSGVACGGGDDGSASSGGGAAGAAGSGGSGGMGGTGGTGATGGMGGTGATGGTGGTGATGGVGGTGGSVSPDDDSDGYTVADGDCDDTNPDVHPDATETCNGVDDNCDNQVDEGVATEFYVDEDGDAYGVDNPATNQMGCSAPSGYSATAGDCDDTNGLAFPGNPEVCDGIDNDCANGADDGVTLTTYYEDADGDGYGNDATTQQGCVAPGSEWVTQGGDCDDADALRFPGNPEVCDNKDNDCNPATPEPGLTTYYQDSDGDGYGNPNATKSACGGAPAGYVAQSGDCDDTKAAINPGAIELCDGIDNNCVNGIDEGPVETWVDSDGDGYGAKGSQVHYMCEVKTGYADNDDDCKDNNAAINPAAAEIPGNGVDENCDGTDTSAGTLCGGDPLAITSIPGSATSTLGAPDPSTGGPAGSGYYWDDIEVSTTAGQTVTLLYNSNKPATLVPRLYLYGPNSCTSLIGTTSGAAWGSPKGAHLAKRTISNTAAGYYYAALTSNAAAQTGTWKFDVVPGDMGGSCGSDAGVLWPLGWRVNGDLSPIDNQPSGTPVPTGHYADDYEFYLAANQTYTLLAGGSPYIDRVYVARAGACGTSLGHASSGILNGGALFEYKPAQAGMYVAYVTSSVANQQGSYTFNVIPEAIGKRCFDGTGSIGGEGDSSVFYPPSGAFSGSLTLTDRSGDFGSRLFDDYETWLEAGDKLTVSVKRNTGSFTPSVRIARVSNCTSIIAQSSQTTGDTGSVTYTANSEGVYVIIVTSYQTNATGDYTLTMTLQ